jgi:LacI family transcriptional regulator
MVTLKMIAQESGVSIGTVDRALKNRGRINKATRERVLEAADRLGYRPNKVARMLSLNRAFTIGVVIPEVPEYFFGIIHKGMEDAAKSLRDYRFSVKYFYSKTLGHEDQTKALKKIKVDDVDGLVVTIADSGILLYINKFIEAGKPVVTYNSDVPNSNSLCYIGQNMREAGMVAGELMGKMLAREGEVAIVSGFKHVESVSERTAGFIDLIESEYKGIKIVEEIECGENEERATRMVSNLLKKRKGIRGIYCGNAVSTVGVAKAMAKNSRNNRQLVIIGCDFNKETKEALIREDISAVISQDPYKQGYYAIQRMSNIILNNEMPEHKHYYIRHNIILKHNCEDEKIDEMNSEFLY